MDAFKMVNSLKIELLNENWENLQIYLHQYLIWRELESCIIMKTLMNKQEKKLGILFDFFFVIYFLIIFYLFYMNIVQDEEDERKKDDEKNVKEKNNFGLSNGFDWPECGWNTAWIEDNVFCLLK